MKQYKNEFESLHAHKVPKWFEDAKLGIFIHWGIYSVPGYAPLTGELGKIVDDDYWYTNNPYAEWYSNSIRIQKGPTYEHHIKTYGKDFQYKDFIPMWKAEHFDAMEWAELFQEIGAKYVILTTKHHDGFCLFDSQYTDFNSKKQGPCRDLTEELNDAVVKKGLKMGLYYSGLIDWNFDDQLITTGSECATNYPHTDAYAEYSYKQMNELVDRFHPSIIWNDIGWPEQSEHLLPSFLAHYFNTVVDGVVNDRFNGLYHDYLTKEYHFGKSSRDEKWEQTRGLGYSFGYNQNETDASVISTRDLISLFVETVANNGNLLLNIGPKADGTIPERQVRRLKELGSWLKINGEGIFNTVCDFRDSKEINGVKVHYTRKGETLYCFVDGQDLANRKVLIPEVYTKLVALDSKIRFVQTVTSAGIEVSFKDIDNNSFVIGFKTVTK